MAGNGCGSASLADHEYYLALYIVVPWENGIPPPMKQLQTEAHARFNDAV